MSEWRETGSECPKDDSQVAMSVCQPCPFFRGASTLTGRPGWNINCNWPRNGSEIAVRRPAGPLDDQDAETIRRFVGS